MWGWLLFARAVVGASWVVLENVVKPGMEWVVDLELQAQVGGYVSMAGQWVAVAESVNTWG